MSAAGGASDIVDKAERLLRDYPLCDHCLGRMFALLGRGMSNRERGRALKTLVVMRLHERIRNGDREALEEFRKLAPRLGGVARQLYLELFGEELRGGEECFICRGALPGVIERLAEEAARKLRAMDLRGFIVAARVDPETRGREDEVKRIHGLAYAESIGSEIKRELGKRIRELTGLEPDFERPDAVLLVDTAGWSLTVQLMPELIAGRYWKTARRVSQSIWVTRRGERRYPFSVEDGLAWLAEVMDASNVVLHAAGREDADVRMLGTGRPFIVEVKEARRRGLSLALLEEELSKRNRGFTEYVLTGPARRSNVAEVKGADSRHSKVYRAIVVVEDTVSDEELRGLEEFFRGREVRQRTPRRVRHRRPDVVRERIVYSVAARRLGARVFEALIHAEGGLYIKELVSGDEGDTEPSFASYLGRQAYCASLDVVAVIPGPGERYTSPGPAAARDEGE